MSYAFDSDFNYYQILITLHESINFVCYHCIVLYLLSVICMYKPMLLVLYFVPIYMYSDPLPCTYIVCVDTEEVNW